MLIRTSWTYFSEIFNSYTFIQENVFEKVVSKMMAILHLCHIEAKSWSVFFIMFAQKSNPMRKEFPNTIISRWLHSLPHLFHRLLIKTLMEAYELINVISWNTANLIKKYIMGDSFASAICLRNANTIHDDTLWLNMRRIHLKKIKLTLSIIPQYKISQVVDIPSPAWEEQNISCNIKSQDISGHHIDIMLLYPGLRIAVEDTKSISSVSLFFQHCQNKRYLFNITSICTVFGMHSKKQLSLV